jgi:hypothetical protein
MQLENELRPRAPGNARGADGEQPANRISDSTPSHSPKDRCQPRPEALRSKQTARRSLAFMMECGVPAERDKVPFLEERAKAAFDYLAKLAGPSHAAALAERIAAHFRQREAASGTAE